MTAFWNLPLRTCSAPSPLTAEQRAFYKQNEYLVLPDVVSEEVLQGAQATVERWVDSQIQQWLSEGKLTEDFKQETFDRRLYAARSDLHRHDLRFHLLHPGFGGAARN